MRRWIWAVALGTLHSGVGVAADTQDDGTAAPTGAIAFVEVLRRWTSMPDSTKSSDWPIRRAATSSYREWRAVWCPFGDDDRGSRKVMQSVRGYCGEKGGELRSDIGCLRTRDGTEDLLFVTRINAAGPRYRCPEKITPIEVWIIEPNSGQERSPEFLRAAARAGFELPEVRRQRIIAEHRDQRALTTRGTRICRADNGFIYVGFVDDVNPENGKIRVLVSGTTTGLAPGGFVPGPIWDASANWRVCE